MSHTLKAALAAVFVVGAAHSAHADLTYQGSVGLELNPTAQAPAPGNVRIQGDYQDQGNVSGGGGSAKYYGGHVAGGIEAGSGTLELDAGIDRLDGSGGLGGISDTSGSGGAKYLFTPSSTPGAIAVAAGVGYDAALLRDEYGYLVATEPFGSISAGTPSIKGSLGVRYDHFKFGSPSTTSSKGSVYGGVDAPVTHDGSFSLVGELQTNNNNFGNQKFPYSAGIRFRPPGQGFSAGIGIARQGLTGGNGLYAEIGYTFSTGSGK